jgi:protein-tyrosine phosphatase
VSRPVEPWSPDAPGVLVLPSGLRVRGRAVRSPVPAGLLPTYALYLLGREPDPQPWPSTWLRWPDFRLPADRADAADAVRDAYRRLGTDRVEVACTGGRGRTGTALACLVALDTGTTEGAVDWARTHYDRHAVETPGQRRYVARFLDDGAAAVR